ncbi:hypothetical protein [Campylobacter sp. RM16188]|nr:hypothetical protein [Campylobacter sp. RM16188]
MKFSYYTNLNRLKNIVKICTYIMSVKNAMEIYKLMYIKVFEAFIRGF